MFCRKAVKANDNLEAGEVSRTNLQWMSASKFKQVSHAKVHESYAKRENNLSDTSTLDIQWTTSLGKGATGVWSIGQN